MLYFGILAGKRPDSILKYLEEVFDEAIWRQPSIILLDDLDHVVPAPSGPEAELSGEAIYGARIGEGMPLSSPLVVHVGLIELTGGYE